MRAYFWIIFYILSLMIYIDCNSYAEELTRAEAESFVGQMEAVINSRVESHIKNFFNYYIQKDATIIKKIIYISNDNVEFNIQDIEYSKEKFIASMLKITNLDKAGYTYTARLDALNPYRTDATDTYTMAVSTEEVLYKDKTGSSIIKHIYNNCNYIIEKFGGHLYILSSSCVEKIM